ncbi:MAG: serine/threonine protein phosphatase [Cytophagaceae bacterium]|nr:serine/threonine protein phosphatase [Cytophagaceae bacterium]
MSRTIAISDIHGCFLTLEKLLHNINYQPTDHLVILGDSIDRGPRSKEVLDLFLSMQVKGQALTILRGNHEVMFLDALRDPGMEPRFIRAGGDAMLRSFGVRSVWDVPIVYSDMIRKTIDYFKDENALYVHAGFNFSNEDIFFDRESMYWEREMDIDPVKTGGRPVIHGHTPTLLTSIEKMIRLRDLDHEINIDNGCVFEREGFNQLIAYFPQTNHFVVQKNCD